jgi:hypothetical protein
MACLGRHGRWGNTLLGYFFLRVFALVHQMAPEVPRWIGQSLFGLRDDAMSRHHPVVLYDMVSELCQESRHPMVTFDTAASRARTLRDSSGRLLVPLRQASLIRPEASLTARSLDLEGPFLLHTDHLSPYRDMLQGLVEPVSAWRERLEHGWQSLRQRGDAVIGVHLRRGDFDVAFSQQGFEFVAPMSWYLAWLERVWAQYERPVLFVASDSLPEVLPTLARYHPVTADDLGLALPRHLLHPDPDLPPAHVEPDAAFFVDWFMLTRCQALAISNSTFSFTASMMNRASRQFVRPDLQVRALTPFDPWHSEPLLFLRPAASLWHDVLRRWLLAQRGLGLRAAVPNVRRAFRWYRLVLQVRAQACRQLVGPGHLPRELLRPSFYLAPSRRYDGPETGPVEG